MKPERIGIIGTLHWELRSILQHLDSRRRLPVEVPRLWEGSCDGRTVVVAECGVGRLRAEKAVSVLVDRFSLPTLVCVGFSGATSENCRPGDVVLCSSVQCGQEASGDAGWACGPAIQFDEALIRLGSQILRSEAIPFHLAICLTVARLIDDPDTKMLLGKTLQADVVDMESYWIARQARGRVGRMLVARAVSDAMDQPLPGLARAMGERQEVDYVEMAVHVLSHPRQAADVLRLARGARLASRNLGTFVPTFVRRL